MSSVEVESIIETLELEGLCTTGTEVQRSAFETVDALPRSAAKKLEADDPRVLAPNLVCQSCVHVETCNESGEAWLEDETTLLPRPFEFVTVVGNKLLKREAHNNLEEIDPDAVPNGSANTLYINQLRIYDGVVRGGLKSDLGRNLYDHIINGLGSDEFLEELRLYILSEIERKHTPLNTKERAIDDEADKDDASIEIDTVVAEHEEESEELVTYEEEQTIEMDLNAALKAILGRKDYGSDHAQASRFKAVVMALRGNIKAGLFSRLAPILTGAEQAANQHEINGALLREDQAKFGDLGPCGKEKDFNKFITGSGSTILPAQKVCVHCPVFAECGVASIFEFTKPVGVRAALGVADRKSLRSHLKIRTLKAVLSSAQFPEVRAGMLQQFGAFQAGMINILPEMQKLLGKKSPPRAKEAKLFAESTLESGLLGVLAFHGFAVEEEIDPEPTLEIA